MRIRILDELEIVSDDGTPISLPGAQRRLVVTLVLAGEAMSSPQLKRILWGDDGKDHTSAFTSLVHKTRRALPPDRLHAEGTGYRFRLEEDDYVDLKEFALLMARGEKARESAPEQAARDYERAVALWGNPPFPDLPDSPAITVKAHRLLIELQEARETLAEIRLDLGQHRNILPDLRLWTASDPYNENMRHLLMLALHRDGRKAEALSVYAEAQRLLMEQSGVETEPGPLLRRTRDQILADASDPPPAAPTPAPEPPEITTDLPAPTRILNFLRGGKDNFEVDRQAARSIEARTPGMHVLVVEHRKFEHRAVRALAEAGIDQFIDLESGLPGPLNTHQVARAIVPDARVVYVDRDPVVEIHSRALLLDDPAKTAFVRADIRDLDAVLGAREILELIDFDRPIAIMMTAAIHQFPDDAKPIVDAYIDAMAPGSYMAISAPTVEGLDQPAIDLIARVVPSYHPRTQAEVARLCSRLEVAPPGIVDVQHWRNDSDDPPEPKGPTQRALCVVARKPGGATRPL